MWKPLVLGFVVAFLIAGLFRTTGHLFFIEGRSAANLHALGAASIGTSLGWITARRFGLRGAVLAAIPGLVLMAAITSHFSLAFPAIDPKLDKGFGGLMLWLYGFMLVGALLGTKATEKTGEPQ